MSFYTTKTSTSPLERPKHTVIAAPASPSPLIPAQKGAIIDVSSPDASNLRGKGAPSDSSKQGDSTPQVAAEAPISQPSANEGHSQAPVAAKQDDPRMMELARKEQLLRAESKRIAAQKAELEALQAVPKQVGLSAEEWKARFLADPSSVGMSYQEMADRYLNQPSEVDQKYSQLQAKIEELEGRLGQGAKAIEEAQAKAYTNAINQMKAETSRLVESSPQDFELISVNGAHDAVVQLIETTYKEDGVLMSVTDAARKVEDYLTDKALKVAGLTKVRAKIAPPQQAAVPQKEAAQSKPTTLSQSMTASSRPLSPQEQREKAIAAFSARKNSLT